MNIFSRFLSKSIRVLSRAAVIIVVSLLVVAMGHFYIKSNRLANSLDRALSMVDTQITIADRYIEAERSLENKIRELEATIKRVVSTSNKIEQARPQLVEWVYEHSRISRIMAEKIVDNVKESSSPLFLLALMKTESNFNPTAISSKGAMGLGQIMPVHKKALKEAGIIEEVRDLFNISTAIKAAEFVWKLKMVAAKGDINKALALYLGVHDGKYVNRILKDYFQLNYLCQKPLLGQKVEKIKVVKKEERSVKDPVKEVVEVTDEVLNIAITGESIYVVKKDDSLSKIAQEVYGEWNLGILNKIKGRNPEIKDIALIFIGQKIILPIINMETKEVGEALY